MTNRNCFADGTRLAQLVELGAFNQRVLGSSPISGSNGILYVSTLYGKNFSCLCRQNIFTTSKTFSN